MKPPPLSDTSPLRRAFLNALRPPAREPLSRWAMRELRLPATVSAVPGPYRPWAFQREMLDAMSDPSIERVTVLKSVRVGFTQMLAAVVGHFAKNDPSLTLAVFPTIDDAKNFARHTLTPTLDASPALRGVFTRATALQMAYPGGSLKMLSASTPRNLRGHTARVLLLDEVDGYEVTEEGDPVRLAINRTLTFPDRKIILGSTPVNEGSSAVMASWSVSDQRVFEIPCADCREHFEPKWADVRWEEGRPETALLHCPACGAGHADAARRRMVDAGRWRATRPVVGHAGFKLTTLLSPLDNAALGKLAAEFVVAKRSPVTLKPFVNTILAEPWKDAADELDDSDLMSRREPFDLDSIPGEVVALTAGVDCQHDRLEMTSVGWTKDGEALVIAHEIVWGSIFDDPVWADLDVLLTRVFKHPTGAILRYDCAFLDAGDGTAGGRVHSFALARRGRRVFAIRGVPGFHAPPVAVTDRKNTTLGKVILVGGERIKREIFSRLAANKGVRFSNTLFGNYFEQLCSERLVERYSRGKPVMAFERIPGRRAETLDCLTYAFAAKQMVAVSQIISQGGEAPQGGGTIKSAYLSKD